MGIALIILNIWDLGLLCRTPGLNTGKIIMVINCGYFLIAQQGKGKYKYQRNRA